MCKRSYTVWCLLTALVLAAAGSKSPLYIGVLGSFTGDDAEYVLPALAASTLAAWVINNGSTILPNHTLVPILKDDLSTDNGAFLAMLEYAGIAARNNKSLNYNPEITDPRNVNNNILEVVRTVIGPFYSSRAKVTSEVSLQYQIPLISPSATIPSLTQDNPLATRIFPSDSFQGVILANVVKYHKWKHVGVLFGTDPSSSAVASTFQTACIAADIEVQVSLGFQSSSPIPLSEFQALKDSEVAVFLVVCQQAQINEVVSVLRELDMTGPAYTYLLPSFVDLTSFPLSELQGAIQVQVTPPSTTPFSQFLQQWQDVYDAFPEVVLSISPDPEPIAWALAAYDAVHVAAIATARFLTLKQELSTNCVNGGPTDLSSYCGLTDGEIMVSLIRNVSLIGATGLVEFNSQGEPVHSTYMILNLQSSDPNNTVIVQVGWANETDVSIDLPVIYANGANVVPRDSTFPYVEGNRVGIQFGSAASLFGFSVGVGSSWASLIITETALHAWGKGDKLAYLWVTVAATELGLGLWSVAAICLSSFSISTFSSSTSFSAPPDQLLFDLAYLFPALPLALVLTIAAFMLAIHHTPFKPRRKRSAAKASITITAPEVASNDTANVNTANNTSLLSGKFLRVNNALNGPAQKQKASFEGSDQSEEGEDPSPTNNAKASNTKSFTSDSSRVVAPSSPLSVGLPTAIGTATTAHATISGLTYPKEKEKDNDKEGNWAISVPGARNSKSSNGSRHGRDRAASNFEQRRGRARSVSKDRWTARNRSRDGSIDALSYSREPSTEGTGPQDSAFAKQKQEILRKLAREKLKRSLIRDVLTLRMLGSAALLNLACDLVWYLTAFLAVKPTHADVCNVEAKVVFGAVLFNFVGSFTSLAIFFHFSAGPYRFIGAFIFAFSYVGMMLIGSTGMEFVYRESSVINAVGVLWSPDTVDIFTGVLVAVTSFCFMSVNVARVKVSQSQLEYHTRQVHRRLRLINLTLEEDQERRRRDILMLRTSNMCVPFHPCSLELALEISKLPLSRLTQFRLGISEGQFASLPPGPRRTFAPLVTALALPSGAIEMVSLPRASQSSKPVPPLVPVIGPSMSELLRHPVGLELFKRFVMTKHGLENVQFVFDIDHYRLLKKKQRQRVVDVLFELYISNNAERGVNISSRVRKQLFQNKQSAGRSLFDSAKEEVWKLLHTNYFVKFRDTQDYVACASLLSMETEEPIEMDDEEDSEGDPTMLREDDGAEEESSSGNTQGPHHVHYGNDSGMGIANPPAQQQQPFQHGQQSQNSPSMGHRGASMRPPSRSTETGHLSVGGSPDSHYSTLLSKGNSSSNNSSAVSSPVTMTSTIAIRSNSTLSPVSEVRNVIEDIAMAAAIADSNDRKQDREREKEKELEDQHEDGKHSRDSNSSQPDEVHFGMGMGLPVTSVHSKGPDISSSS